MQIKTVNISCLYIPRIQARIYDICPFPSLYIAIPKKQSPHLPCPPLQPRPRLLFHTHIRTFHTILPSSHRINICSLHANVIHLVNHHAITHLDLHEAHLSQSPQLLQRFCKNEKFLPYFCLSQELYIFINQINFLPIIYKFFTPLQRKKHPVYRLTHIFLLHILLNGDDCR